VGGEPDRVLLANGLREAAQNDDWTGPDLRRGVTDTLPSGNTDVAPTILWILGVPRLAPMDGRVLLEAMPGHTMGRKVSTETLVAKNPANGWEEYLSLRHVGTTEYIDEGNRGEGPQIPLPTPPPGTPQTAEVDRW